MNILFLDSATEACTAGLWQNGEIFSRCEIAPRAHTKLLLPMVELLLLEAGLDFSQLDLIAFGRGPGSFTGVRIATACAQGMAMGLDIPVLGISSLAILAQAQVHELGQAALDFAHPNSVSAVIHAALDARMGEVYHAAFTVTTHSVVTLMGAERVVPPEVLLAEFALPSIHGHAIATGTGFGRYPELVRAKPWRSVLSDALPDARFALELAAAAPRSAWQNPADAAPVYLRDNVAQVKAERTPIT
ncbi:MAG: tRNA (adenosine(37)-N6)-threonylcarbamoyltransferase complex dimerization subunit type 1 TsaB [Halothiobacillus sp.]